MAPDPTWLEIAETGGMAAIAFALLFAFIKGGGELLKHKKANDEARAAMVNKVLDALIEKTKDKDNRA